MERLNPSTSPRGLGKLCLICPWKGSAGGHTPGRSVCPLGRCRSLGRLKKAAPSLPGLRSLSQQLACARPALAVFTLNSSPLTRASSCPHFKGRKLRQEGRKVQVLALRQQGMAVLWGRGKLSQACRILGNKPTLKTDRGQPTQEKSTLSVVLPGPTQPWSPDSSHQGHITYLSVPVFNQEKITFIRMCMSVLLGSVLPHIHTWCPWRSLDPRSWSYR